MKTVNNPAGLEVRGFWTVAVDRPYLQPVHVMCFVRIGPKNINLEAAEPVHRRSGRGKFLFIYGSSGFGTLDAANSRRRELMRKIVLEGYRFRPFEVWDRCRSQLAWERKN